MSIDTQTTNVTSATGNVFADLGFEPQLAAELKSQSQRIIAEKLAIKEHLLAELAAWIQAKELTRTDAALFSGALGNGYQTSSARRPRIALWMHWWIWRCGPVKPFNCRSSNVGRYL